MDLFADVFAGLSLNLVVWTRLCGLVCFRLVCSCAQFVDLFLDVVDSYRHVCELVGWQTCVWNQCVDLLICGFALEFDLDQFVRVV